MIPRGKVLFNDVQERLAADVVDTYMFMFTFQALENLFLEYLGFYLYGIGFASSLAKNCSTSQSTMLVKVILGHPYGLCFRC
jgi:hypothetical protein